MEGWETLTKAEKRVLWLLVHTGGTNHEIAKELCVTETTIKFHFVHIFEKIGCKNRTQAAVAFVRATEVQEAA